MFVTMHVHLTPNGKRVEKKNKERKVKRKNRGIKKNIRTSHLSQLNTAVAGSQPLDFPVPVPVWKNEALALGPRGAV